MGSIDAENVAKEVVETLGSGKKVILGEIIRKNGYADNTADNPKNITETESYKRIINPVVDEWIEERNRLTKELKTRDLKGERYETVMKSIDLITKNIQLLSGGKTENIGLDEGLTNKEKEGLKKLLNKDEANGKTI